jgi:hypothetical protein
MKQAQHCALSNQHSNLAGFKIEGWGNVTVPSALGLPPFD